MAVGAFDDVIVVEAENLIHPPDNAKPYSTVRRTSYAAGVGIIRVESTTPAMSRELVEFFPVREPIESGFGD